MKRELFIHFAFWFSFFVFIAIIKKTLNINIWPFFVGGVIGTLLPDIDHLIYVYLVKPYELASQRFIQLIQSKELKRSVELLYETRGERTNLIFHSQFFQALFLVVTFWVMSSSGSVFGKGVALAFALHLVVDQMIDIYELNKFEDKREKITFGIFLALTILVGFM